MAPKKKSKQVQNSGADLIEALNQISKEKGIDQELIFETIEASLLSACKKNFGTSQNIRVVMDRESGQIGVYAQKEVVEEVNDDMLEISVSEAEGIDPRYSLGDVVEISVTPRNFGRIAAQTAKQVVVQKFREAERELLYNEYIAKEREAVTAIVQRKERKNIIMQFGKIEAFLPPSEQIPGEELEPQSRVKVYVTEVKQTPKGPQINVSRTHPELVKRLFEQEVPEIYDGIVEIKSISREPGARSKISVLSKRNGVDAVGACVGTGGYRVGVVVSELRGEKIDVINWKEDPRIYIAEALKPSQVLAVAVNPEEMSAKVVVEDNQLSLAIGKDGQNARLAARLTGWRIDIKSRTQANEMEFVTAEDYKNFEEAKSVQDTGKAAEPKSIANDEYDMDLEK